MDGSCREGRRLGKVEKSWDGVVPRRDSGRHKIEDVKFIKQKHPHKMTRKRLFLNIACSLYTLIIEHSKDILKVRKRRLNRVSGRSLCHLFPKDPPLLLDAGGTS